MATRTGRRAALSAPALLLVLALVGDASAQSTYCDVGSKDYTLLPGYEWRGNLDNRDSDIWSMKTCNMPLSMCPMTCTNMPQCVGFTYVASGPNAVCCYFKHTETPLVAFRTGNGVRDCGVSYRRVRPAGSVRELLSSTASLSIFYQLMEYATNPATGTLVDDAFAVWDFQRLTWIFDKADGDVTVLAPSNAAYAAAGLTADSVKAASPNLYKYLLAHILPEPLPLSALLGAPGADYMSLHAPVHYIAAVDVETNTVALEVTGLPAPQRIDLTMVDLVAGSSFVHAMTGFVSASMDGGGGGGGIGDLLGGLLRR